jgi:hypothetical protein
MSYLNPLRVNFAGKFKAAPSTVNNDPTHFNNATFRPQYQGGEEVRKMAGGTRRGTPFFG